MIVKKSYQKKFFDIGSHSINHKLISKLNDYECVAEVGGVKKVLLKIN